MGDGPPFRTSPANFRFGNTGRLVAPWETSLAHHVASIHDSDIVASIHDLDIVVSIHDLDIVVSIHDLDIVVSIHDLDIFPWKSTSADA